jgi:hypothetical protein
VYRHTSAAPAFSLAVPTNWQAKVIQEGKPGEATVVDFTGAQDSRAGTVDVLYLPFGFTHSVDPDVVLNAIFASITHGDGTPD